MSVAVLAGYLAKSVGMNLAKKIIDSLLSNKSATDDKIARVKELIETGSTAITAFEKVFGTDFDSAVSSAISTGTVEWTYEAATAEYVKLEILDGTDKRVVIDALRDELNINLDRLARMPGKKEKLLANEFLGVFRIWMRRYREFLPKSVESEEAFSIIESLLDGQKRTFRDVFGLLKKSVFGVSGAMMILSAVMVATSTGVGVFAALTTWLLGVPLVQVAALAVTGVALTGLAFMDFSTSNAMSASVAAAYKLLDHEMAETKSGLSHKTA